MHDLEVKKAFIKLKSQDISFDKISKELNIGKTTLVKWNEEFSKEINNLRYLQIQNILEECKITQKKRIEYLCSNLEKIETVISARSFEDVHIQVLHYLRKDMMEELNTILKYQEFYTGENIDVSKHLEDIQSKEKINCLNKI